MDPTFLHFFVDGRVQGVGFRRFVSKKAKELSLTGWVRNTFDHRVEVLACGDAVRLSLLLQACQKGPLFSSVVSVTFADVSDTLMASCPKEAFVIER